MSISTTPKSDTDSSQANQPIDPASPPPSGAGSWPAPSKKPCTDCGRQLPCTSDCFPIVKGKIGPRCRQCRKKQKREQKNRQNARRRKALAAVESAGVEAFVKAARMGGTNIPHSAEVVERIFEYFGGVGGFTSILVKQYWDAKPGSSQRNRMMETICRLVSKNVEQGGAKKPLTLWTEEELEDELQRRLDVALESAGVIVDARAEPVARIAERIEEDAGSLAEAAGDALARLAAQVEPVRSGPTEGTARGGSGEED